MSTSDDEAVCFMIPARNLSRELMAKEEEKRTYQTDISLFSFFFNFKYSV